MTKQQLIDSLRAQASALIRAADLMALSAVGDDEVAAAFGDEPVELEVPIDGVGTENRKFHTVEDICKAYRKN